MKKTYTIYVLWIIIFLLTLFIFPKLFDFIEVPHKPNYNPPWYFILNDFKSGLAAVMGVILSVLLLGAFPLVDKKTIRTIVLLTIIWYSFSIGNMISIILNTENLLDPEIARTDWATQKEYLDSAWRKYLFYIYIGVVGFVYISMNKKNQKEES